MATSVVNPRAQFFANNGRPLIGGRIHTYVAGSSTRATTYKDAAKAQPNTNPIVLDGRGEAQIYLAEGVEYKFVVEDSKGALIYTQEPVYGAIWPNAADWPSDATLSYQYMTEAKAIADAVSVDQFYETYEQALADVANIPDDGLVEITRDEVRNGARTRYFKRDGGLVFAVNMDQLRQDLATGSGADLVGFIHSPPNSEPRTSQAKARDWYSVKDAGAKGDGSTDDTAAFNKADASGFSVIYVPHGTYILDGAKINGKKFFGPGVLKWKAGATQPMITLAGVGCELEGLTFDGNAAGQTSNVAMIVTEESPGATLRGCSAKNGRYKFLLTDVAASPGVLVTGSKFEDWGSVSNCDVLGFRSPRPLASSNRFENVGDGHCIRLGLYENDDTSVPVSGAVITGNSFRNTHHVGVTCELHTQGASISGNTFENMEQGVKIEILDFTCFDIAITGNTFKGLTISTANNLHGRRITFSGNTCIDCAGSGADMGTDSVCSGNVFINCGSVADSVPSVRLTSTHSGTVISDNIILNAPWRGVEVNGANCTCTGNQVRGAVDRSISVTGANANISNNRTVGGTVGLLLSSAVSNAIVQGNNCSGATTNYSIDSTARLTSVIDISNIGLAGATVARTISAGAILAPRGQALVLVVDTEAGAASDDLDTINVTDGGFVGQLLVLRSSNSARVVTVKDSTQLRIAGDFVMNSTNDAMTLIWVGSQWYELSRSDNA